MALVGLAALSLMACSTTSERLSGAGAVEGMGVRHRRHHRHWRHYRHNWNS
jgi:hypothetical protein